jgi:hypothetical protein
MGRLVVFSGRMVYGCAASGEAGMEILGGTTNGDGE